LNRSTSAPQPKFRHGACESKATFSEEAHQVSFAQ
jgi:hypothetical protein